MVLPPFYRDIPSDLCLFWQVFVANNASLSAVGGDSGLPLGAVGGAGGVIQIISPSGLLASRSTLNLRSGLTACHHGDRLPESGFLLVKGT